LFPFPLLIPLFSLPIYKPTLPHFTGRGRKKQVKVERERLPKDPDIHSHTFLCLLQSKVNQATIRIAMEFEDDLFFADLSKQISLLIMDDDEQDPVAAVSSSVSFQAYSRSNYPTAVQSPFMYEQSCRRESKGTGGSRGKADTVTVTVLSTVKARESKNTTTQEWFLKFLTPIPTTLRRVNVFVGL
ncbi:hypothetical protein LINPERHAP1_LOCUS20847, partial [Linum perenne]